MERKKDAKDNLRIILRRYTEVNEVKSNEIMKRFPILNVLWIFQHCDFESNMNSRKIAVRVIHAVCN